MNKGLKVLSGVLALTIGLATAGMVGALSKGAQEILKIKEPMVPEYKFYEAITTKPEYAALLKKADKEYKGLTKDSAEWARLSAMACNAAQGIESINNQLDAIPHFLALAEDMATTQETIVYGVVKKSNPDDKDKATTDPEVANKTAVEPVAGVQAGLLLMTPENHQLKDLLKVNAALKEKVEAGEVPSKTIIAWGSASYEEQLNENAKEISELVKYVSTQDYKDAADYVANYTEEKANTTKARLLQEKTDLNGLIAFVTKIANENGLKLMDKCALPQDANVSEADKAASGEETQQKDTVPNTAAGGGFFSLPTYVRPLIPTKVVKVEKKAPAFTFEALNKLELLPRAQKTVVVVEVEAPAFTFEGLNKLELLPRR